MVIVKAIKVQLRQLKIKVAPLHPHRPRRKRLICRQDRSI